MNLAFDGASTSTDQRCAPRGRTRTCLASTVATVAPSADQRTWQTVRGEGGGRCSRPLKGIEDGLTSGTAALAIADGVGRGSAAVDALDGGKTWVEGFA